MPSFETKRKVPFTARQMYEVVAGIEHYPEFLPMCTGLRVTSRQDAPDGTLLVATMSVGYKAIRESFTTRVTLTPSAPRVDVSYLNGPFSHLTNRWLFVDLGAGQSEIDFYITYQFRSAMLGALVGAVFDQAFRKFTEAFEARARTVYSAPAVNSEPIV